MIMPFLKNEHGVVGTRKAFVALQTNRTAFGLFSPTHGGGGFPPCVLGGWFGFGVRQANAWAFRRRLHWLLTNPPQERGASDVHHELTVHSPPTRRNRDINREHNRATVAPINRERRKRALKKRPTRMVLSMCRVIFCKMLAKSKCRSCGLCFCF